MSATSSHRRKTQQRLSWELGSERGRRKRKRPQARVEGRIRHQKAQIRHDIPRRRVNKAETCLLGTLAPHRGARPGTEAPETSLKVAGISLKTPENVAADWPPPQEEHDLAGAWLSQVTLTRSQVTLTRSRSWLLDSTDTEEWVRGPGMPSRTLADGEGLPAEAHDLS